MRLILPDPRPYSINHVLSSNLHSKLPQTSSDLCGMRISSDNVNSCSRFDIQLVAPADSATSPWLSSIQGQLGLFTNQYSLRIDPGTMLFGRIKPTWNATGTLPDRQKIIEFRVLYCSTLILYYMVIKSHRERRGLMAVAIKHHDCATGKIWLNSFYNVMDTRSLTQWLGKTPRRPGLTASHRG